MPWCGGRGAQAWLNAPLQTVPISTPTGTAAAPRHRSDPRLPTRAISSCPSPSGSSGRLAIPAEDITTLALTGHGLAAQTHLLVERKTGQRPPCWTRRSAILCLTIAMLRSGNLRQIERLPRGSHSYLVRRLADTRSPGKSWLQISAARWSVSESQTGEPTASVAARRPRRPAPPSWSARRGGPGVPGGDRPGRHRTRAPSPQAPPSRVTWSP